MKISRFESIIKDYIFNPEVFWPDDSVFHRRNRDKIVKARARVGELEGQELISRIHLDLEKRCESGRKTLYVISCGSSGCHFLGEMLSSIGKFDLVKEVYYPPALLNLCSIGGVGLSAKEKRMLFDLVSYFPSRGLKEGDSDVVPVNIMHLRGDTPTYFVKNNGEHHLVLLMRNPFDIAYSRSFRKDEYRAESDPAASDKEYLIKQINNVRRFYGLAADRPNRFDDVVRYEDLISNPYKSIHDLLFVAKDKFPEAWQSRGELSKMQNHVGNESSINYNPKKKAAIGDEYATLFKEGLSDLAEGLGYFCPEYIS